MIARFHHDEQRNAPGRLPPLLFGGDGRDVRDGAQSARLRARSRNGGRMVGPRVAGTGGQQGSELGQPRRASHDGGVQRLSMPLLLARRSDARTTEGVVRQGKAAHRLEEQPHREPPHAKPAAEAAQGSYALAGNEAFWNFPRHGVQEPDPCSATKATSAGPRRRGQRRTKFKQGLEAHTWVDKVDRARGVSSWASIPPPTS